MNAVAGDAAPAPAVAPGAPAAEPGAPPPEVFALPGIPCGKALQPGVAIDEYVFSRFVLLFQDNTDGQAVANAVPTNALPTVSLADLRASRQQTLALQDVVARNAARNAAAPPQRPIAVSVPDTNELLASSEVETQGGKLRVQLSPTAVTQLLQGHPIVVDSVPAEAAKGAAQPASRPALLYPAKAAKAQTLSIPDLSQFLSNPVIGVGGVQFPVKLTSEGVQALVSGKRALLSVGDIEIPFLAPNAQQPVSPPGAAQTQGPLVRSQQSALSSVILATATTGAASDPADTDLALWLPWKQSWQLVGYAQGELLNSFALAPEEQMKIEVFTWDRLSTTSEQTSSVESSNNLDVSNTTRSTVDVVNEFATKNQVTSELKGDFKLPISDALSIGFGVSASNQQSIANSIKTTTNVIHEGTSKASSTVKQSRQTKVSQTQETGSETRVTRTITNPNKCHTLTIDCYEVIAKWRVTTALDMDNARLCWLVANPVQIAFTQDTVREYESSLRKYLLDPALIDGFAGARLLDARGRACDILCNTCTCASSGPASDNSWSADLNQVYAIVNRAVVQQIWSLFYYVDTARSGGGSNPVILEQGLQGVYYTLLGYAAPELLAQLQASSIANSPTFAGAVLISNLVTEAGGVSALAPGTLLKQWHDQLWLQMSAIAKNTGYSWLLFSYHSQIDTLIANPDDAGLGAALTSLLADVSTAQQDAATSAQSMANAMSSTWSLGDVASAEERVDALLSHLADHADYYRYAIYQDLASNTRFNPTYGSVYTPLLEPRAIGYLGSRLAFPLITEWADPITGPLLQNNPNIGNPQTDNMVLPTPGVHCEARLGQCDACESFIEESRQIEIRLRDAQAKQAEHEAARLAARLAANPPLLDDPDCCNDNTLRVQLIDPPAAGP